VIVRAKNPNVKIILMIDVLTIWWKEKYEVKSSMLDISLFC
jgi:hypothetical protein